MIVFIRRNPRAHSYFLFVYVVYAAAFLNAQMAPRSSDPNFSISLEAQDILKEIFHRGDKVTVSSAQSEPKNAVLLESFLLRTRPAPRETRTDEPDSLSSAIPILSTITFSEDSSSAVINITETAFTTTIAPSPTNVITELLTTFPALTSTSIARQRSERQGKGQPTGRPNYFYLGGNGDTDGWWSSLDDLGGEDSPNQTPVNPVVSTTTDTDNQFSNFYGGVPRTTPVMSEISQPPMTLNADSIPPPFVLPVPNSGQLSNQISVTDSPYPPNSIQSSGLQPTDRKGSSPANTFYEPSDGRPPYSNVLSRQPPPNWGPFQAPVERRQGSVLAAPDPVPQPKRNSFPDQPVRRYPNPDGGQDDISRPFDRMPPVMNDNHNEIPLETCSVGDDSTCNQVGNEVCRKDDGASTCMCRMGTARKSVRDSCQGAVNFYMYVRINRLQDRPISYGPQFADKTSYPYIVLSREITLGVDSILRSSDLRDNFVSARLNSFGAFSDDILANLTVVFINFPLESPGLPKRIQQTVIDSLSRTDRRLGTSNAYVSHLFTAIPSVQDINECISSDYNDCNSSAHCINTIGSFQCQCKPGYVDPYASDILKSGRHCETCEESFCSSRGVCLMGAKGKMCQCNGWYIGASCETDGQVVAVACGSSAIALILIAITLVFLLRWSRSSSSQRGGSGSTLARSEISANTFTYVHGKTPGVMPENSLDSSDKMRLAYVVHPSLLNELPPHHRSQLLDSNFYEVRPPPGKLASGHALLTTEKSNRQRFGSRDQLASDLSSSESEECKRSS